MRSYTLKQHLVFIVIVFGTLLVLWMTGVLPEAPPLISK
jgi:hypothetical protein